MSIVKKFSTLSLPTETEESSLFQRDSGNLIDYRKFWNFINQKYFAKNLTNNFAQINLLIQKLSEYVPSNNQNDFKPCIFPRSFVSFLQRMPENAASKKISPLNIAKFLGLHLYIDKCAGLYENSTEHSPFIKDEINLLTEKLKTVQKSNFINLHSKKNEMLTIDNEELNLIDFDSEEIKNRRFDNLMTQIYNLQMKQFAESIYNIKADINNQKFLIEFDPAEKIGTIVLKRDEYIKFMEFRDPLNSVCVYDLFQEKVHSYYNNERKRIFKSKEKVQVGKRIAVTYDYCHHCKQRKPEECMLKCKSFKVSHSKTKEQSKVYNVNGTTIIRQKQSIIIKNFADDPSDFIDAMNEILHPEEIKHKGANSHGRKISSSPNKSTNSTNQHKHYCNRTFCHFCLKGSYDTIIEKDKNFEDWLCPYCTGQCFCSRCTRFDTMLKLVGTYISLGGDIEMLFNYLVKKSSIMSMLQDHMILKRIFILVNDPTKQPKEIVEQMMSCGEKPKKIRNEIQLSNLREQKENTIVIQRHFEDYFEEAKMDQNALRENKETFEEETKSLDDVDVKLLGKKRKREKYDDNNNSDSQKTLDTKQERKYEKKINVHKYNIIKQNVLYLDDDDDDLSV